MKSVQSHTASRIPSERALASTSVEEMATVSCFFKNHNMGLPADLKTHPMMDYLSILQFPQSKSV